MEASTQPSSPLHSVQTLQITAAEEGQRLDNFLIKVCKGVPKTHLYKLIRAGELRVNKKRTSVDYRLQIGDTVRIPPMRRPQAPTLARPKRVLNVNILHEDEHLLIIEKPYGLAVHGGSGIDFGLIEQLRYERTHPPAATPFLELVHRLDRDTSGLLMIAKTRRALVAMHDQMRQGTWRKEYVAVVHGQIRPTHQHIRFSLRKWLTKSGERRVSVDENGQYAHTEAWSVIEHGPFSLLRLGLKTGRTHQLRVHLATLGTPIVGDDKYGDDALNQEQKQQGFARMFLHAFRLVGTHPITQERISYTLDVPEMFFTILQSSTEQRDQVHQYLHK